MRVVRTLSAAVCGALLSAAPAAAQLPAAQALVDRHVEAIGGREAAARVQSRRLVYEIDAGGMAITAEVRMRRPNLLAAVTSTPMGEARTGYDGTTVWGVSAMGAQILQGAQAADVRERSGFDADLLYDIYPVMETVERTEYGGKPCYRVRMVTAGGTESFRCFDAETGLMLATTQTQGGVQVTAVFDRYLEVDGVKYPAHSVASVMGQAIVTTLRSVEHADIPASAFALPDEVKALQP